MWWRLQGSALFTNQTRKTLRTKENDMRARNLTRKQQGRQKIFVVSDERYDLPVGIFGKLEFDVGKFLDNPKSFSLVVLPGGEDITPAMYAQRKNKACGYTSYLRDQKELYAAWVAVQNKVPIVGICRGAQLLNIFAGGSLIQHCDNHGYWHDLETNDGRIIYVSSTHHQMMIPPQQSELIAWATPRQSTEYVIEEGNLKEEEFPEFETDVVSLPTIRALALQYHPEYMQQGSDAFNFFYEKVQSVLGVNIVRKRHQDHFVNLPKEPLTKEKREAEEALITGMTKKELTEYYEFKDREGFIRETARAYMSLLYDEDEALELASEEFDAYKAAIEEQLAAAAQAKSASAKK